MRSAILASLLLLSAALAAQQPQQPAGSVIGTVLAQDTRRPIRFAAVQFQSVSSVANANGARFGGFGGGTQARTEIDGTFVATGLEPGDYYVTASAPGYVPERALLAAAVAGGSDPGQLLAGLPTVHVDSGGSSTVNLTLQRGGALGGRLVWEDGSPAAGVQVSAINPNATSNQALPAPLQGLMLTGYGQLTITDDRGEFRISGLPSGDYQIVATIQSWPQSGPGNGGRAGLPPMLRIYSPGVFRKSAAKAYPVRAGEERMDLRMVIDLRSLRTVSGHVGSTDGSRTPASGRVTVTDASDPSLVLQGAIDAGGSFTIRYVPAGNYTLSISGATTQAAYTGFRRGGNEAPATPATNFQSFSQPVIVTDADLSGISATLTPVQTQTTNSGAN